MKALNMNRPHFGRLITKGIGLSTIFTLALGSSALAESKDTDTVQELLEILKAKEIITDQQYQELAQKAEEKEKEEYTVKWNNGMNFQRNDGKFKIKLGGRIHFDAAAISPDSSLESNEAAGAYGDDALEGDGVEFRRSRLYLSGTIWDNYVFKAQYDFAGGDADWKDVYLGVKTGAGTFLAGQMHEPFSLEELTSSNYITFMERSLPTSAFAPSRKSGIRANGTAMDKMMTWGVGLFYGDTDDDGDSNFDDVANYDITGRVSGLPLYRDKGKHLLHLGLGYSYQARDEGEGTTFRYRSRPESHITDVRLVNTGRFTGDSANLINPEFAYVLGPFSLQGEYFYNSVESEEADDPTFHGAYLYTSYFLTGESRSYSTSSGKFGRVKPQRPFMAGGPGAWEVAARWSWLDLTDSNITGGEETNFTLGVNWYMNQNYRLMANYVYADVEERDDLADGKADIFQLRFQADF